MSEVKISLAVRGLTTLVGVIGNTVRIKGKEKYSCRLFVLNKTKRGHHLKFLSNCTRFEYPRVVRKVSLLLLLESGLREQSVPDFTIHDTTCEMQSEVARPGVYWSHSVYTLIPFEVDGLANVYYRYRYHDRHH